MCVCVAQLPSKCITTLCSDISCVEIFDSEEDKVLRTRCFRDYRLPKFYSELTTSIHAVWSIIILTDLLLNISFNNCLNVPNPVLLLHSST